VPKDSGHSFNIGRHSLKVSYNDIYDEHFWGQMSDGGWEPSTFGFVEFAVRSGDVFVDIGSATGAFTLIAAQNGAKVVAVEPYAAWRETLEQNIADNGLKEKILVVAAAVSDYSGSIGMSVGSHRAVLSDITFTGLDQIEPVETAVLTIEDLVGLEDFDGSRLVIKMDIEGAEYAILKHSPSLKFLQSQKATLLVSLHPGFPYAIRRLRGALAKINRLYQLARGFFDNLVVFSRLLVHARVFMVNGTEVTRGFTFAMLAVFGSYDYVVRFSK
jgi:FkbM family methyltransferase